MEHVVILLVAPRFLLARQRRALDPAKIARGRGRAEAGTDREGESGQLNAAIPVISRPTIRDWIESVPS
jgi:hypothetical protein